MHPACRLTTGVVVVTGEELIRPLSALGDRFPLTLISQLALPPPTITLLQQHPENLLHKLQVIIEGHCTIPFPSPDIDIAITCLGHIKLTGSCPLSRPMEASTKHLSRRLPN